MSLATLVAMLLTADALSPERAAAIEAESAKELQAVDAKYGNRKLSELSNEERRALGKDKADAERKVLEKNGVSLKDWARGSAKRSPNESAQVKQALQQLEKRERDAAAAAKKGGGPKEIQVQRGFNDETPVVLEEAGASTGAGGVTVGAEADAAAARDADAALRGGGSGGDSDEAPKPASKSSRKR